MRFDLVGKKPRISRDREPGTVLGKKRISCARCGVEYPTSELSTIPPGDEPGRPRIYVCRDCR